MKKKLPIPRIGKRTFWKISFFGTVFLLVMILGTIGAVHYTERPQFCATCHNMRPYIQAWKTSKHSDVPCVECHFEPGVLSTIKGKFIAINQLTKYVTRTAGPRPSAEVSDRSCLRSGCHERRLISGKVKFGKITFDHRPHMLSLRRGKKLRCTSCHSQIMIGSHMAVTETTCFLCHFKNEPQGVAIGGCLGCHKLPKKDVVVEGVKFNHKEYIKEGAACNECHVNVTSGNGNVSKERCVVCHGEPERLARYSDSSFIHRNHVTDHKVECMQCHDQIEHGAVKMRSSLKPNCSACHGNLHTAQRDLYAGTGGRGVIGKPSVMFLSGVECEGCHTVQRDSEKSHFNGTSLKSEDISCEKCHGSKITGVLGNWKKLLDERMATVTPLLSAAEAKLSKDGAADKAVRDKFEDARYNVQLVRYGRGAHNIEYARELLDSSEAALRSIVTPGWKPKPAAAPGGNCTQLCHVSPPARTISYLGKTFPHGRHSTAAGLACKDCHSVTKHKLTTITKADCATCHHRTHRQDCKRCHAKDIGSVKAYEKKKFPHARHIAAAKISCETCHIAGRADKMTFRQDCVTCHTKKKPVSHKGGWRNAHGKASLKKDAPCAGCHDRKKFCDSCHRIDMPHAGGWAGKKHAAQYRGNKAICMDCHKRDFCDSCHRKTKAGAGPHPECRACHDEKTWAFKGAAQACERCHKNKHSDKAPAKHKECTGCHEPHSWKPDKPEVLCKRCHSKQSESNSHVSGMSDCTICHAPHDWKAGGNDVCFACHDKVAKDVGKHNVMADCSYCHETHKWKMKSVPDTCKACHSGMEGHDESFSNCPDCHTPHVWKP